MQEKSFPPPTPLQERLQVVTDWGTLGMWEIDLVSGKLLWSARADQILGLQPGNEPADLSQLLDFVHPEDLPRVRSTLAQAIEERWPSRSDSFRIIRADGQTRHLTTYVRFQYEQAGAPSRMIGIAQDVTESTERNNEREDVQERLRITHDASNAWTWQLDLSSLEVTRPLQGPLSPSPQYGPTQLLSDWFTHVHPEDRARVESGLRHAIETGEVWQDEFRFQWPSGEYKWIYDRAKRVDRPGRNSIMAGAALDVTERKQVEQQLVENEERLRSAYIAGKMWPWEVEADSFAVRRTLDSTRYTGPEHPSTPDLDGFIRTVHPDDQLTVREAIRHSIRSHAPYSCEYRVRWTDGTYHWVTSRGGMVQDHRGVWKLMGVAADQQDQKLTAQALEESERLRLLALDAANMGVWSQDMRTGQIHWSARQCTLFGIPESTFTGDREIFRRLVHLDDLVRLDAETQALAKAHARRFRFEFRITRPNDGEVRWIATAGEFEYGSDGKPVRMSGVNYDVTEAKQKETALRESEAFRRLAMGAANMGAWQWDVPTKHLRWSEEQERLFGFEPGEFDSRLESFLQRLHPEDLKPLHDYEVQLLRSRETKYETEFRIVLPDRTERWIGALGEVVRDANGTPVRIYGVNFDITDRKRTEHALRTGEKLATAGRMAASLAHEINNPLAAVTNLLYLIGQDTGLQEATKRFVSLASSEVARVSHITRNILAFYRETTAPVPIDLAELVESVVELYSPKIRDFHIQVQFQAVDHNPVIGFPGELRQVTSNLIVNAIEAMPRGGLLRVRVQTRRDWRSNRSGIRVLVADTGSGIPKEVQSRLFEPFFTTKGEKGTGLGLWVSRDIINKHDGTIRVRSSLSEPRRGTCFSLFLPADAVATQGRSAEASTSSTGS